MRTVPAALLGMSELRPVDLATGMAGIVNGGVRVIPHTLLQIRELDGKGGAAPQWRRRIDFSPEAWLGPDEADSLRRMLRGVVTRGTAARTFQDFPIPLIGKTGTSQGHRDAWFVGLTQHLVIVAWIGNGRGAAPAPITGGAHAAPLVADILARALQAGLVDSDGRRPDMASHPMAWPAIPF